MIVDLANRAGASIDEFRARLNDAQIGASGHGLAWEARARAVADQMAKEKQGVLPGQVVGVYAADDLRQVEVAQKNLTERLRKTFDEFPQTGLNSGSELEQIRSTPFKVWHERAPQLDPAGSMIGMGWKVCVAVPPDAHQKIHEIIEGLPSFVDGIQVWAEPWQHAPGREQLYGDY